MMGLSSCSSSQHKLTEACRSGLGDGGDNPSPFSGWQSAARITADNQQYGHRYEPGDTYSPSTTTGNTLKDYWLAAATQPKGTIRLISMPTTIGSEFDPKGDQNASSQMIVTGHEHSTAGSNVLWVDLPPEGGEWDVQGTCGSAHFKAAFSMGQLNIDSKYRVKGWVHEKTGTFHWQNPAKQVTQSIEAIQQATRLDERRTVEIWLKGQNPEEAATPAFWKRILQGASFPWTGQMSKARFLEIAANDYGYARQIKAAQQP